MQSPEELLQALRRKPTLQELRNKKKSQKSANQSRVIQNATTSESFTREIVEEESQKRAEGESPSLHRSRPNHNGIGIEKRSQKHRFSREEKVIPASSVVTVAPAATAGTSFTTAPQITCATPSASINTKVKNIFNFDSRFQPAAKAERRLKAPTSLNASRNPCTSSSLEKLEPKVE